MKSAWEPLLILTSRAFGMFLANVSEDVGFTTRSLVPVIIRVGALIEDNFFRELYPASASNCASIPAASGSLFASNSSSMPGQ